MKSENKNFLLNVVYQCLTYIFPLITVSYVSHVLGVENIGIYSYTYSIVYIFMLFGMMGINNYGNRSVAKIRDDKNKLSIVFSTIYGLQLILFFVTLVGYIVYICFFCKNYILIATIQIIQLISIAFDVNWFFFGIEKFKLTITRNLIIKLISLVLIFVFIKDANDLWKYTLVMAISTLASQLYLVLNLRRFVDVQRPKIKNCMAHLKGALVLFIPVLAYSVYRVMDKTMMGFLSTMTELGCYENAERLINIPIAIINALGTVMLPRMAYLIHNDSENYKKKIFESMRLAMILATIMAFGLVLISDDICLLLFGEEFIKSGSIVKMLAITIILSGWANVIRTQYLIPNELDRIYVVSTIGGALVNLVLNSLLIGRYGSYGACIGTIAAELFVMGYQTYRIRRDLRIKLYFKELILSSFKSIIAVVVAWLIGGIVDNIVLRIVVEIVIAIVAFFILYYDFVVHEFFGLKRGILKK